MLKNMLSLLFVVTMFVCAAEEKIEVPQQDGTVVITEPTDGCRTIFVVVKDNVSKVEGLKNAIMHLQHKLKEIDKAVVIETTIERAVVHEQVPATFKVQSDTPAMKDGATVFTNEKGETIIRTTLDPNDSNNWKGKTTFCKTCWKDANTGQYLTEEQMTPAGEVIEIKQCKSCKKH
jgi:hypothetical protein